LATGNGRRITAGGVDGTSFISGEDDAELDVDEVELGVWDVAASGGDIDSGGGRAESVGKEAPGVGGGRTKVVGRSELGNDLTVSKGGAGIGEMSSVSYENFSFEGEHPETR
jgi:hypothetical protein